MVQTDFMNVVSWGGNYELISIYLYVDQPITNTFSFPDFLSRQIFDGYYHFEHRHLQKRSLNPSGHHQRRLDGDDRVRWAKQQRAKRRPKRDFRPLKSPYTIQLNDPKWGEMWYLVSRESLSGRLSRKLKSLIRLFFFRARRIEETA